ncbi:hypothetical protein [Pseudomonas fluorescens]|uniref:hypothetical protein n=1 Tax=Pseudomonas fluorescens TaxID=294 RepID=UPI003D069F47
MINLSKTDAIWLVPKEEIVYAFDDAVSVVKGVYRKRYGSYSRVASHAFLKKLDKLGPAVFRKWGLGKVSGVLESCARGGKSIRTLEEFETLNTALTGVAHTFFKLVFIVLWCERKVLLPSSFTVPTNQEEIVDEITLRYGSETLTYARSVNPCSLISYRGALDIKDRRLRGTFWYRLVLCSTIYNPNDLTEQDIIDLHSHCIGISNVLLARFYVRDFLLVIAEKTPMRDVLNDYLSAHSVAANVQRTATRKSRKESIKTKNNAVAAEAALSFLEGDDHTLQGLLRHYSSVAIIRKSFAIGDESALPEGYKHLPKKVIDLCVQIDRVYKSFIRSKRLQEEKNSKTPLNFILCYCAMYLFKYYMNRDGHLGNYPATLNDFSCSFYVTADELLLEGVAQFTAKPPQTLLSFIKGVCERNFWNNETHYLRVQPIDHFFSYIVENNHRLVDADRVENTFTSACYPRVAKRHGTVKKPIPRAYFATFLSMLYSLEYLVMHLNEMADGKVPGIVDGELVSPSITELNEHPHWSGIWGSEGLACESVNLGVLSYSPIFYHEDKIQRFEYIPRFYRIAEMEIHHRIERRVVMNDIRLSQLMCETGIRQKHLIWLDKDQYDRYLDRGSRRVLAPLFVTTDKAHGAWSAITSRHVIDLLDRQRGWYEACTSADYQEDLWYGMKEDSQFGRFKPLFRTAGISQHWANYRSFPLLLLCLQYFIRAQLKDFDLRDIVWERSRGQAKEFISDYRLESLASLAVASVRSDVTPHGLRAGFVSEAIKFLPPSLVGRYFTGQTEELVYYYALIDDDPVVSHEQLLFSAVMKNVEKVQRGEAPHLSDAVFNLNKRLMEAIQRDPESAITEYRLMSLARVKGAKSGIDIIRARESASPAYNATHICPFNNICPKEVAEMFGLTNVCAVCPFAIRGVDHLPAISAEKDKYKELMVGVLQMIADLLQRKPENRNEVELEKLEREHDHFARQAVVLEAIEMQLVEMANSGQRNSLVVQRKEEVIGHYQRVAVDDSEKLLKRLIDAQNFPDLTSPDLDCRLAYLRGMLLMETGNLKDHLGIKYRSSGTVATQLAGQISSMVGAGAIDVFDVYRAFENEQSQHQLIAEPVKLISQYIA